MVLEERILKCGRFINYDTSYYVKSPQGRSGWENEPLYIFSLIFSLYYWTHHWLNNTARQCVQGINNEDPTEEQILFHNSLKGAMISLSPLEIDYTTLNCF